MTIRKVAMSRRALLRGAGAILGLPLLDGMVPAFSRLEAGAAAPRLRLASIYVPMGANMAQWTPPAEGPLRLSPTLKTLEPDREQMLVLSGLDSEKAVPRPDDGGGSHSRAQATWATGVHIKKTDGLGFAAGVSMDQKAAQAIGQDTPLPSLELALESVDPAASCSYGYTCAYSATLAWRTPTTPLPMEINPRAVFERLFGDADSTDRAARQARLKTKKSILDAVTEEVARLQRAIGPADRAKVDEYLDAVRDVERRIVNSEARSGELPVVEQPTGVPDSYEEHARLMFDLLALAWQTDLTRVATFMMSREYSVRTYPEIGISEPHHPLSHHGNNPEKLALQAKLNVFHLKLFAQFVETLRKTKDGDGSLLDHSLLLYGSGLSNSDTHSPLELPTVVVAGRGANLRTGRHVRYPAGTPFTNLQVSLLNRIGCPTESFGDSTGALSDL